MGFWHNSAVVENGHMYFLTEIEGDFVDIDLSSGVADYLIPDNIMEIPNLSCGSVMCLIDNTLFGIAEAGRYAFAYDLSNNCCDVKEINRESNMLQAQAQFHILEDSFIIVPFFSEDIIRVFFDDLHAESITIPDSCDDYDSAFGRNAFSNHTVSDNKISFYSRENACLYTFDFSTNTFVKDDCVSCCEQCKMIFEENGVRYMLSDSNIVYKFDQGKSEQICSIENGRHYYVFHKFGDKLFFFPAEYESDIMIYDMKTNEWRTYDIFPDAFRYDNPFSDTWGKYGKPCCYLNETYFAMHCGNHLFKVDESGNAFFVPVKWPSKARCMSKRLINSDLLFENNEMKLDGLIEYVCEQGKVDNE